MRTLVLTLHRWTGLTAGIILVFVSITGALIVFRAPLEPVLNPNLLTAPACASPASLDTLAAAAAQARPRATLDYVRMQQGGPGAARVPAVAIRFTDQTFAYLDPCSARVLGLRQRYGGMLGTIEELHRFRFMPNGSLITGTCALLLVFLLAGCGLWLWWPGSRRAAWRSLGLDRSRTRGMGLHRRVGAWIAPILVLSALTGLPQAYDWYKRLVYRVGGSEMHERVPRSLAAPGPERPSLESLWRTAQALVPQASETLMHFPGKPGTAVDIYLIGPDAPHVNARTMLYLDANSGAVLEFVPYANSSPGSKLYFWTLTIHMGQWGGLPLQLLLLCGALGLPLLAWTGLVTYWRRYRMARSRLPVRVAAKDDLGADVCEIELAHPHGGRLPKWEPGAHIDLCLGDGLVRPYSLCGDPRDRTRYVVCVRRAPASRGGSAWVHEQLAPGQALQISRPRNHFPLSDQAPFSVLLAGGIGITPLIAMADHLSRAGRPFALHCCAPSADAMPLLRRLRCARYVPHVRWHFSRTDGGRLRIASILAHLPAGSHLYVCGPAALIDAAVGTAHLVGWSDERIHVERFGATVACSEDDHPFEMELARSGKVLTVPARASALSVLVAAGVAVPRSCEQGVCGSCATPVLSGSPLHRDHCLSERERAINGVFIPCCSRSRSRRLVLDL